MPSPIAPARLERALDCAGTHDEQDIDLAAAEGRMQRWTSELSTIITEIQLTPKRKTVGSKGRRLGCHDNLHA
jgi:hypothetical protein